MRPLSLLIFVCLFLSLHTTGQNETSYSPITVFVDLGKAFQQTNSGGGVIEINPGYTFSKKYRFGFQWAFAGFDEHTVTSYILTFDYYYFQNHWVRLSAGGGYGFYTNSDYSLQALPPEVTEVYNSNGKMGGNIRLGIEWRHLSLRIAWHMVPNLNEYTYNIYFPPAVSVFKGNYIGLTFGIRIGGGK